jgi:nitroimidazol reductase NimA-like FMN-containing flavoprotein (pyridoxamine 5'-phosphate oxidase superfamily)
MWNHELSTHASLKVLAHTHLGRLACVRDKQPYIVPVNFAYHDHALYSFSLPGQKIAWMRDNPLVCIEADQMRREYWATVVVFGRYEELTDTPKFREERTLAFTLLQKRAMWWEHAGTKTMPGAAAPQVPIYYRIGIERITGRCGATAEAAHDGKQTKPVPDEQEWLLELIQSVRPP